ncbi:MAG TPA: T9SS type A sorting domain-containing protein [Bacteroidales bacterium]|nr:T9SS type A sorting domain-containing protein [Bacteroidales bacterium]
MQIFPNPTKSQLTFRNIPENSVIEIYNLDGKVVKRISSHRNEYILDISFLKKGLYMIKSFSEEYFLSELLVKE